MAAMSKRNLHNTLYPSSRVPNYQDNEDAKFESFFAEFASLSITNSSELSDGCNVFEEYYPQSDVLYHFSLASAPLHVPIWTERIRPRKLSCEVGDNDNYESVSCSIQGQMPVDCDYHSKENFMQDFEVVCGLAATEGTTIILVSPRAKRYGTWVSPRFLNWSSSKTMEASASLPYFDKNEQFEESLQVRSGVLPVDAECTDAIYSLKEREVVSPVFVAKIVEKETLTKPQGKDTESIAKREIVALSSLRHRNILRLYTIYEDDTAIVMITQYASGGSIRAWIDESNPPFAVNSAEGSYRSLNISNNRMNRTRRRLSDIADVITDLLSGLSYMHNYGVVHQNIRPETLFFRSKWTLEGATTTLENNAPHCSTTNQKHRNDEMARHVSDVIISNFECAAVGSCNLEKIPLNTSSGNECGSPVESLNIADDIRGAGEVFYELLFGVKPSWVEQSNKDDQHKLELWMPHVIDEELRALLFILLDRVPCKRPSAFEALSHPWLSKMIRSY